MKKFVVVVDMQHDFVATDGALPVDGAPHLVAPMQAWLAGLRADDIAGVLFTKDTHIAEIYAQSEEARQFPLHCERGTPGWDFVIDPAVLAADIPCYTLEKGVFDMWGEPGLAMARYDLPDSVDRDVFFTQLRGTGVDDVIVVGVAADYCVRWAVEGLIERGFHVTLPADMTCGIARRIETVAADEWSDAAVSITTAMS